MVSAASKPVPMVVGMPFVSKLKSVPSTALST
jgi:hypothetical protein